ncbi:MAG: GntR family transcriptional regulator [Candidatus Aminicenantes bacterium]|nr:GntR family transcriptional regulator [Candidatus Aminicenantes bacterium]
MKSIHGQRTISIPKTLSQSIYRYLKREIVTNRLKAGEKINDKDIANLFQVSQTPVREAIFMLNAEGLVDIKSHKETIISELSFSELKEIFHVLDALEPMVIILALNRLTAEDVRALEEIQAQMERCCHRDLIEKYCEVQLSFHEYLWKISSNGFLKEVLDSIRDHILRYNEARYHAFRQSGTLEFSLAKHKEILAALKAGNKRKLRALMATHWGPIFRRTSAYGKGIKEFLSLKEKAKG